MCQREAHLETTAVTWANLACLVIQSEVTPEHVSTVSLSRKFEWVQRCGGSFYAGGFLASPHHTLWFHVSAQYPRVTDFQAILNFKAIACESITAGNKSGCVFEKIILTLDFIWTMSIESVYWVGGFILKRIYMLALHFQTLKQTLRGLLTNWFLLLPPRVLIFRR